MPKHGLSEQDYEFIQDILKKFLPAKSQTKVSVFGSRARGDFKKYSDLDLYIESSPNISSQDIQILREQFEDSDLTIKVDVVTPESVFQEYWPQIQSELKPF